MLEMSDDIPVVGVTVETTTRRQERSPYITVSAFSDRLLLRYIRVNICDTFRETLKSVTKSTKSTESTVRLKAIRCGNALKRSVHWMAFLFGLANMIINNWCGTESLFTETDEHKNEVFFQSIFQIKYFLNNFFFCLKSNANNVWY